MMCAPLAVESAIKQDAFFDKVRFTNCAIRWQSKDLEASFVR